MNQALLYSKYNGIQRNDALFVLDTFFHLMKWNKEGDDVVLDIGCGSGDVTEGLLLQYLPQKIHKLIGVDISEEMIEFARKNSRDERVSYEQLNVSADEVPVDLENHFDHIFSFYCLHWVADQRRAFRNIHSLMKPGGDMLITFLASNPIFDIYEALSKKGRWEEYMENFSKFVSPYQHSKNPARELRELLKGSGFIIKLCSVLDRIYIYPNIAVLKKSVTAVTPFYDKIPESDRAQYLIDYMEEVKKLNLIEPSCNNNDERVKVPYKLFVIYANKVSN